MNVRQFLQDHYKSLIMVPFLAMNGTLALMETLQRFYYFDKEKNVGVVSELFLGPIRSAKMIPLDSWNILVSGPKHNKRIAVYQLYPEITKLSSNVEPGCKLSAINCQFASGNDDELCLSLDGHPDLLISFQEVELSGERIFGIRFKDTPNDSKEYQKLGDEADNWISNVLGIPATMLYVPETKLSGEVNYPIYGSSPDKRPAPVPPVHITSITTLEEMNKKSGAKVEMARLRPNLVVKGNIPGAEGFWKVIKIGDQLELEQTFMNPRCGVVNALDGKLNPKVYDTIYKQGPYRDMRNRPCFGSYWKVLRPGVVHVGDKIMLLKSLESNITGPYSLTDQFVVG